MFLQKIIQIFINFLYPSFCLHCNTKMEGSKIFCPSCLEFLTLVEVKSSIIKAFASFEMNGPASSLYKALKRKNYANLFKGAASFIVWQFVNLKWPIPDLIIPSRVSYFKKDEVYWLAKEVAKILDCPFGFKSKNQKTVLVICDCLTDRVVKDFKEKYVLGLCFDISFDHMNFFV